MLFVLGNGFDLAHGLPTSYYDFNSGACIYERVSVSFPNYGEAYISCLWI